MTSRPPRRVMRGLSQRLVRLALLASATSLFSYAGPVSAQLPVFRAEPIDEPEPAPATPIAPEPTAPLPPPPPAPVGAALAPSSDDASRPVNAPAPAKAALITAPGAHREAEARAEKERERDDAGDAEIELGRHWYGWQTLTADGVSITALLAGVTLSGDGSNNGAGQGLAWFGLLGYELAPGFVHFVHRNPGRGFASFGMRLGLPLAGAFVGASLASGCDSNLCEASGAGAGILIGMGAAIALDAAVFAYDDAKHPLARHVGLMPLVSVTPRLAWFGVGGDL
ncbi:MAG: hypothetical protein ABUL60_26355 [Myxococcales bacterium]